MHVDFLNATVDLRTLDNTDGVTIDLSTVRWGEGRRLMHLQSTMRYWCTQLPCPFTNLNASQIAAAPCTSVPAPPAYNSESINPLAWVRNAFWDSASASWMMSPFSGALMTLTLNPNYSPKVMKVSFRTLAAGVYTNICAAVFRHPLTR